MVGGDTAGAGEREGGGQDQVEFGIWPTFRDGRCPGAGLSSASSCEEYPFAWQSATAVAGRILYGVGLGDQLRDRPKIDLLFLEQVMRQTIPASRPAGSAVAVLLTGLSSGGYMTVRAATYCNGSVKGFALVSSGDPYGWHRMCEPGMTPRVKVPGAGYDNETDKQIVEQDACRPEIYPNEAAWDDRQAAAKPSFRMFHHEMDGVSDISRAGKVARQLRAHSYPSESDFLLRGGRRGPASHLWQDECNRPILDFFTSRLAPVGDAGISGIRAQPSRSRHATGEVAEPDH